jgi:AcrR family transcriptional regulator
VLDAALELFTEKGYAAARVEDIAKRAGISKGAVYLYFPSKQAIIEGLVRRTVTPIVMGALENIRTYEGHPRDLVRVIAQMLASRLSDPKVLAVPRLIMREIANFPELAEMYRTEVLDQAIPVVTEIIRRGIEQGYFRPVDPELTIRSLVGPLIAHLMLAELFGIVPKDGLAFDRLLDNHLTVLFEGLNLREGVGNE